MMDPNINLDDAGITQPTRPPAGLDSFQPVQVSARSVHSPQPKRKRLWFWSLFVLFGFIFFLILVYFFGPFRTNVLVLGIDGGLGRGELGRTDTMILTTISPLKPYVGLLSIPRDLWVPIEGVGENRINTAYFFAEAQKPGSGPQAAIRVVDQNFHVRAGYYLIVRMDGLLEFIDAMGGVDIQLSEASAGYATGTHHLDGTAALVFARSRAGSDDFSRMGQGQILIKAVLQRMLQPAVWPKLPDILKATQAVVDMNIPVWQWPRLGLALLRVGQENIDARSIMREMVRPFTTNQGAQVLEPNWEVINVLRDEMFGKR
ncbi:MAG: LCP family protein [Chloroflexota bacterium]